MGRPHLRCSPTLDRRILEFSGRAKAEQSGRFQPEQPVWPGLGDGSASSRHLGKNGFKAPSMFSNGPAYLVPMMFRNQTARICAFFTSPE